MQAASKAAAMDTSMMGDGLASNGITAANLLTASKDEDLVF